MPWGRATHSLGWGTGACRPGERVVKGWCRVSSSADRTGGADRTAGHESAALDEIELAGELMIAATASNAERLPTARIDEVLLHQPPEAEEPGAPEGRNS